MRSPLLFALVASLTLGLAPFRPEPHLVGKLRWVMGGGEGMTAMDVFDLLLHGVPWVVLIALAGQAAARRLKNGQGKSEA